MAEMDLSRYSTIPLFNTKAVVQQTGVSAATLRAWERRYGVPEPNRTESNYRLYSERDIALIRWLRERVEVGIAISHAVEMARLLDRGEPVPTLAERPPRDEPDRGQPNSMAYVQERLIEAFKGFEESYADRLLGSLFALYPIEDVLLQVIQPAMVEIGEQWHRGEVSVSVEHFATAYVERKLMAIINAQPTPDDAPLVVAGCAPREQHELGILILSLLMRRVGLRVVYLGQNVPLDDLRQTLATLRPAMVALSAMTPEAAEGLHEAAAIIATLPPPRPLFAVGGGAFERDPALADALPALHLGPDARAAARDALRHIRRHQKEGAQGRGVTLGDE